MLKKISVTLGAVLGLVGLYGVAGLRVSPDGSGMFPRFVSRAPDYDGLEEDRARQRELTRTIVEPSVAAAASPPTSPVADPAAHEPATMPATAALRKASGREWTDFRGSNRDGRYVGGPIRVAWPDGGLPLLWKHPIGAGYASFVVADGRAFTIEQRRDREVAAAYDLATGLELWTASWPGLFTEWQGGDGPRATPTYHDARLYVLGALGELRCLEAATGAVVWRRDILEDAGASNLHWGMAASPLVVDGLVVVLPGGRRGRSVSAYDSRTGVPVWNALDDQAAYTSPMVATLAGERQLLVVTATRVVGLTIEAGKVLWQYPWRNDQGINVAQPLLLGDDRIFLSASYGSGAVALDVRREGGALSAQVVWETQRMRNRFTSAVLHEGYIYGLDESILACLDVATGEQMWKGGRYGYGQLVIAGDRLIVLTEDGEIVQVRASPDGHEEVARFDAISGKTWNHPVMTEGILLVRNLREMAAFDLRPVG